MGVIRLEECDWEAVAARIEKADGPIAWFWMAARHQTTRQWKPVLLTIRGATRAERRVYPYRHVLLGSEQLSPTQAAARFRKGIVRPRLTGEIPALRCTVPPGTDYPFRVTTEAGGPYYLAPAGEWPQFFSSWSLNRDGMVEPGLHDQLSGDDVPFFPSLHGALAGVAYGVPTTQLMTSFQPQVVIRLPDLRARIGKLAPEDGAIQIRIDEGKKGGAADCRLEAVWKESAGELSWRRAERRLTGPGFATIETGGVPAEMWVLLSDAAGGPLDRAGWSVEGSRPAALGPLDARVEHLVQQANSFTSVNLPVIRLP